MSIYPTVRPSLTLDFQKSKQLDPRITFSRSSSATYVEGGVVKTADEHQARFEEQGLLLEESRTNYIPNSTDFTGWNQLSGASIALSSAVTAPDGGTSSSLFTADGGTGYVKPPYVIPYNTTAYLTLFVKAASENVFKLNSSRSSTMRGLFDMTTGLWSSTAGSANDYTAEAYPNGWWKLTVKGFLAGTSTIVLYVLAPNITSAGTDAFYMWGCQIEHGSFPTSLIPSAGSTVTRAAETCQLTGSNFYPYINRNAFTILFNSGPVENNARLLGWGNGGVNLGQIAPSTNFPYVNNFQNAGSQSINLTTVRDTDGSLLQATAYAENDFAGQSRGRQELGLGPSTSSGPCPVLNLGTTQGIKFCGYTFNSENNTTKVHIKSLAIYSERLTNEQLGGITS